MRLKKAKHHGYAAKDIAPDERAMYMRFVIPDIDEDSLVELGIFHAVWGLRRSGKLSSSEEQEHDQIIAWFNENLERPTRFTASKPPFYRKKSKAISWFKDDAREHLANARALVAILKSHGIIVRTIKARRVGYIVYEDQFQIVAEPFAGERY